jgi:hypothetical protein
MHQDTPISNKDFIRNHIGKPIGKFFYLKHLMPCLCLGALSFNTSNKVWGDYQNSPVKPMINASHLSSGSETHPESYESYQLRILRNQNYLQAEKIKTLREEMHEITQKLHELKPHLFKHGDPADQAKIAQLTVLLEEKEETLNGLTAIKEQLNGDLGVAKKKLVEMEIVKEALAMMVDSHRNAKERNTADFQKQLAEIQLTTEQEKTDLQRKIQQHEAIQEKLNQQLATKGHTINRLDDLTTKMNLSLSAKNDELLQLEGHILSLYDIILQTSEHHATSRQTHENQVQDLVTALDWERTKSYQLGTYQEETQWLSDILNGTQAALLNEIAKLQETLAAERAKSENLLDQHGQHTSYLKQKGDEIQKLVLLIELEQTRSQSLENELLTLLNQQEVDSHHLNAVEVQLYEINSRLASKHDELENATSEFTLNLAALLSHLDGAQRSADQANGELETLTSKYNDNFSTMLSHLNQHDEELGDNQDKYAQGIGTLFSHLDHSEQASQKFLTDYLDTKERLDLTLVKKKQNEENLQKSLEETYAAYKQENHRLAELENLLEETMHQSKLSEIELISKNVILATQEKSLDEHQIEREDLWRKLAELENLLEETMYQSKLSEMELISKNVILATQEESLDQHQAERENLGRKLAELENLLEETMYQSKLAEIELISKNVILATQEESLDQHQAEREDLWRKLSEGTDYALNLELLLNENLAQTEQLSQHLSEHRESLQNKERDYQDLEQTHTKTKEEFNDQLEAALLSSREESLTSIALGQALDQMAINYDSQTLRNEELEFHAERIAEELTDKAQRLSLLENKLITVEYDNKELAQENLLLQEQINTFQLAQNESKAEADQLTSLLEKMRLDVNQAEQKLASLSELEGLLQGQTEKLTEKEDHITILTQNHESHKNEMDAFRIELQDQLKEILSKLTTEETKNKSLLEDLNFARSNYTRERSNLLNLEKIHQENQIKLTQLQKQSEQHETALKNASQQMQNITQSKAQIKDSVANIYQKKIQDLEAALEFKPHLEDLLNQQVDEAMRYLEISEENQKLRQENEHLERQLLDQTQKIAELEHSSSL